jgi:POT family proton-dependent oligopeptide transporter
MVVVAGRKLYVQAPPRGSIFVEAGKLLLFSTKVEGGMTACKPSELRITHPELIDSATWDDIFVDEMIRTLKACKVFCWFPIYWLCYNQMTSNLVSMAATMQTGNVPNDILQNIDPIVLIFLIPIMDRLVYPGLRRLGISPRPIMRITIGFFFASVAMAYTAGIQSMVYNSPPYYNYPSEGDGPNDITVAYQIPSYVFIAVSEVFASITGYEYAYKKAPESMKSLVMALYLLANCFSSILNFALVSVAVDPKIIWLFTGISAAMGVATPLFYLCHHKRDLVDVEEDAIARQGTVKKAYGHATPEDDTELEAKYEAEMQHAA